MKRKKTKKKKVWEKQKKCLKKTKKEKKLCSLSLPTLFVGQRNLFYSKDRLVQNHILLLKVRLIHWDANIFLQENTMSHKLEKKKKKAVAEEGGGRSCV